MPFEYELNLHHLELFHAVVRLGGVGRAARDLGVSQPAVSRQLQELEARAGVPLLERVGRGVRPTEAGSALAGHAAALFALRDVAARELRERAELRRGRLSLGASRTIGSWVLPRALRDFAARHPGIDLAPVVANTSEIERRLAAGEIEVALVEGRVSSLLEQGEFDRDELVAVAAPDFFPEGAWPGDLASLVRHRLLLRERGSGSRALVESALAEAGVAPVVASVELDSAEALRHLAEAGLGAAFLPRLSVASSLREGRLREIPLRGVSLRRSFRWIAWPGRPLSPAATAFLDGIRPA